MEMMPFFSNANVKQHLADTLHLFVGHGRLSWDDLSAATGDPVRKLRSYVEADGPMMPMDVFMRVFAILPPAAFARVALHMGFSAAPADCDDAATVRRTMSGAARFVADANEFMEDGVLSPRERSKLADRAAGLLPLVQALAAQNSGGGTVN